MALCMSVMTCSSAVFYHSNAACNHTRSCTRYFKIGPWYMHHDYVITVEARCNRVWLSRQTKFQTLPFPKMTRLWYIKDNMDNIGDRNKIFNIEYNISGYSNITFLIYKIAIIDVGNFNIMSIFLVWMINKCTSRHSWFDDISFGNRKYNTIKVTVAIESQQQHFQRFTVTAYIHQEYHLGAVSIRKMVLPGMAIPMLKIRRPKGRLIFNMEITIRR